MHLKNILVLASPQGFIWEIFSNENIPQCSSHSLKILSTGWWGTADTEEKDLWPE